MENWRTREMELHSIPDSVFSLSFEDILKKLFSDLVGLDLNPIELLFYHIFDQGGWKIERTPLNRSATITRYKVPAITLETGIKDELFGAGVPDFFLWDSNGQYRFVEVKASEDELNSNQLEWAKKYDCKFCIAQLAPADPELTDEEIIERNRIQ